jgi:hypothetical protein
VRFDPGRQFIFTDLPGGNPEHYSGGVSLVSSKLVSVTRKKQSDRHKRRSLVSVHEWMIARNAKRIRRCQPG